MKKLLLLLVICFVSCSEDKPNCDSQLQQLETLRSQGWINCNGSAACVQKIESDYQKKKSEVLNNCK
jgi:hypothetical protein